MKNLDIILSTSYTEEHNTAMADLIEILAEGCIWGITEKDEAAGVWKSYAVRVDNEVAKIFKALSDADDLRIEEANTLDWLKKYGLYGFLFYNPGWKRA